MVSVIGIGAPLIGAWALVTLGPGRMFAAVGVVQAMAALPLIGAPNVPVKPSAPGAFRAARLGVVIALSDGWFDACFFFVWQIALFISLGKSLTAYGGAMALAALAGAVCGLMLGRHIDQGNGRRAVVIAASVAAGVVLLRAISIGSPWLALAANALGALVGSLIIPALATAHYNLAKAAPCPMRFHIATEAGWDVGCSAACLTAAGLAEAGIPLSAAILLGLPGLAVAAMAARRYYGRRSAALRAPARASKPAV